MEVGMKNKQRLKKQLEQQANQMLTLNNEELLESILASCSGLLRMAEEIMPKKLSEPMSSDVYVGYLSLAKRITSVYEKHFATMESQNRFAFEEFQEVLETVQAKQGEANKAKSEYEEAKVNCEMLQRQIDTYKAETESEKQLEASLQKLLKEYSPEKLQAQKEINEQMFSDVTEQKQAFKTLQQQKDELEEEQKKLKREIFETQTQINALPSENAQLLAKYKELSQNLEELKQAEIECSVEKQQELQAKIDALLPTVQELQVTTEMLSNRLDSLQQQQLSYDTSKQQLSTNIVEVVQDALSDLKKALNEHEEVLKATEETAQNLASRLLACQKKREEYQHWFEADKSPLEAMMANLNHTENEMLRKTLDIGQISSVKSMMTQTQRNLEALDKLLAKCASASQKDFEKIKQRAHP